MEIKTLTKDQIVNIHNKIDPVSKLISPALLESAVGRQHNMYGSENPVSSAVTLCWGIIKNHAFSNANKRTGFVSLVYHLDLNAMSLAKGREDFWYNLILGIADGSYGAPEAEDHILKSGAILGGNVEPMTTITRYGNLMKRLSLT